MGKLAWPIWALHAFAIAVPACAVTISPEVQVGPIIQRWGWDIKGNAARFAGSQNTNHAYGDVNANLLRIPIFAPLHSANGDIDVSGRYSNMLTSIRQVQSVNPDVQIFASLKLDGADTFPSWVTQPTASWQFGIGAIFSNLVAKPNPEHYSALVAKYVDWLRSEGIKIDYLGLNNETEGALTWDRYIGTVDLLQGELDSLGVPASFRNFQLIGPDSFGIPTAENFVADLASAGRLDTIDIAGSHFYPQYSSGHETDWEDLAVISGKSLWHTEVHMPLGNQEYLGNTEQGIRDTLSVLFASNRRGVDSFVWWGYNTNEDSLASLVRGNVMNSTLNSHAVQTSPDFTAKEDAPDDPLFQAFRNGNRVALWISNPGQEITDQRINVDWNGIITAPVGGGPFQSHTAIFWDATDIDGPTSTIAESLVIDTDAHSLLLSAIPADSVGVVYFDLWQPGDANLDGWIDQSDVDSFVGGWLSREFEPTLSSWKNGDFDRDGMTSMSDFMILRRALQQQGQTLSSLDLADFPVPEPSAGALFAIVGGFWLCCFRFADSSCGDYARRIDVGAC